MSQPSSQPPHREQTDYLRSLLATARERPGLWFVPLFSAMLVAILMAYLGPKTWDATQSFVVREELIGRIVGPGRFESLDSMKTAQEVIQETARRPVVLQRVLESVNGEKPTRDDIEGLREAVSFHAPGGAELGKTEILTMRIKSSTAERARQLVDALFEATRDEVRSIRQRKAQSMVQEAGASVQLSQERLAKTAAQIRRIEASVGGDLSELRGLNEAYSSGSDLRRQISAIGSEIRQARKSEQQAIQLINYLTAAVNDPLELLATPRELLESQPALSELKNQLIEAQVNRSNVGGIYSAKHPRYVATANSVDDIRNQINLELNSVLVGLKSQQNLARQQIDLLNEQSSEIENRIGSIANLRVDYSQLANEMNLRNQELTDAHKEYAQAESILRAAESVDFMAKLDEAVAGFRPLGPSKKSLVLGAAIAGLLIGIGLVMMVTPSPTWFPPSNFSNRPTNHDPQPPTPQPPSQSATRQVDPAELSGVSVAQPAGGVPGFVIPDIGQMPLPNQQQ